MNVLLLRLSGPMQSWGVQSRFNIRETGLEPSKSGVIGLLCAALGRPRTTPLADLAALHMGVRVDQEGRMAYDFHTAQNVRRADGGIKGTEISRRYYLADAKFLVGLASEDLSLLKTLHHALRQPVWPLYLGRKACVPGESVWLADGLCLNTTLYDAFHAFPLLYSNGATAQRLVLEDENGVEIRLDQPISFAERAFAPRRVRTCYLTAII